MSHAFDRTALLHASESLIGSEVDGETMLISIETGEYFGLDQVGTAIWRLVQAPVSFDAMLTDLQAQFNGDPAQIDSEASEFVAGLIARGLLTVGGPGRT